MKILGFILLFLFGIFFSQPFNIVQSTRQVVNGGRMETGSSEIFLIKMVAKKPSTKLQFEDLWIGVTYYSIKASHQNPDNSISNDFEKGDTIYIQAVKRSIPDMHGNLQVQEPTNKKNVPIEYEGNALIGYTFKGVQHYAIIKDFQKLKTENRP